MTQFNIAPYYDDFDEAKKFLKVLYRPGYAVQTRELNTAQTILQNQISRLGNHIFKNGAMVIPGNIGNEVIPYVKLNTANSLGEIVSTFIEQFEGTIVTGQTSGIKALVIKSSGEEGADPNTLLIKYINSGNSSTDTSFADGEILVNDAQFPITATAQSSTATGFGTIATVQSGIYYINGNFVLVDTQTLILEKYLTNPSYRIGLQISEEFITPEQDTTLYDNALGSPNQSAPGAHRYKINTTLVKLALDSVSDSNFIELLRLDQNIVQLMVTKTEYSELEKTLARRTYDESGDYVVSGLTVELREHRNNDRGEWIANTNYVAGDIITYSGNTYVAKTTGISGTTIPTLVAEYATPVADGTGLSWQFIEHPIYNRGIYQDGDESKFVAATAAGKAYVRGYELEKFNTSYVEINKSRSFDRSNSTVIGTTVGNYVLVTSPFSIIEDLQTNFPIISLYDSLVSSGGTSSGTKIGEARVRWVEQDDVTSTSYKLFLFNIVIDAGYSFERDVKSVYYNNTTLTNDFTANIVPVITELSGSIATTATTVTGTGTKFVTELKVGDYISYSFGGTSYLTKIDAITNDNQATITGGPTISTPVSFGLVTTTVRESNYSALVFPLPNSYIRSIRGSDDLTFADTAYHITKFYPDTQASGTTLTLNVDNVTTDTFAPITAQNYTVINTSGAYATGYTITPNGSNTQIVISGLTNNNHYVVLATIRKQGIQEKTKTLNVETLDVTTASGVNAAKILLKPDVYKILSIKQSPAFGAITTGNEATLDVIQNYSLDNGQRPTHYDIGSISLLTNSSNPTGSLRIVYEYFTHSSGHYFSVDSYKNVIPYNEILPILRDSLDFRPRIIDAGTGFNVTNIGIPKRGFFAEADFSYYLAKKSNIELDIYGNFTVTDSSPALAPKDAPLTNNSLLLAKLDVNPYTLFADNTSVSIQVIDNKRYTMRDIGKLEQRIANVEYYTALSLLEQETKSMTILDSTGLDRYKNGFLVDSFNGHGVGNSTSIDYKCSIDSDKNELRPMFSLNNIDLVEYNQRSTNNYQVTGDVITLPYTNQILVNQEFASRVENVNPFAIFTFIGAVSMKPSSDNWFETKQAPNVVVNKMGNYNSLLALAKSSNALGTSWGSWNTVWSGVPVQTSAVTYTVDAKVGSSTWAQWDKSFGAGAVASSVDSGHGVRHVTLGTFASTVGQSRSGVKTSLVSKIDRQEVNNKIIATSIIPYMRKRNVLFVTRGLKPSSKFYAFFDGIDINSYITPASSISFTSISGYGSVFDSTTNVANDATNSARQFNGNVETALTAGDVLTGLSSGATAIVALTHTSVTTGLSLSIVNVKGTFAIGETITGSISGARGKVTASTIKTSGQPLYSNVNGDICGIFSIPNNTKLKFRTGDHEFKLSTSITNGTDSTSHARGGFSASGVINTMQKTIVATRNAEIVRQQVNEKRTTTELSNRVISDSGWYDPLAQSFLVRQSGGAFLTGIDIYFASKDDSIPVQMELREMTNGYPSNKVLPNSRVVLTPDKVNVSTNVSTLADGTQHNSPDASTRFTFESPVYVSDNTEYCVVLLSDSNNYNVWISQLGDKVVNSDRYISEQPYAGVLFKSQNASTWTADQYQDLTFKIYRAKFDTSVTGIIKFNNINVPTIELATNSIQTLSGSNLVRIWQPNHGMVTNDYVALSGFSGTINGIPSTELNNTFQISNADFDTYTISVTSNATITGFVGGEGILATQNYRYETLTPNIEYLNFPETSITMDVKTTGVSTGFDTTYKSISINDDTEFTTPRSILSSNNETSRLSGAKSFELVSHIASSNDAVSPVIDTHRLSVMLIGNLINSYSSDVSTLLADGNYISTALDTRTIATGAVFSINNATKQLTTSDVSTKASFKTTLIGKMITLSGATTTANNGTYRIIGVDYDGGTYITLDTTKTLTSEVAAAGAALVINDYHLDDVSGIGSNSVAKYITNTVSFLNPSTHFTLMYAYNLPSFTGVDVYYKVIPKNSTVDQSLLPFTLVSPDTSLINSDTGEYFDAKYSHDVAQEFSSLVIKLVLKSTNTAYVPTIKDFRVIACA